MDAHQPMPANPPATTNGQKVFWWILLLLIVVFVVVYLLTGMKQEGSGAVSYEKGDWQAVFLDNGQVYFGKVDNDMSDPVIVKEIYYLQVVQPLQQVEEGQTPAQPQQPQLSLVKLGNELHGPTDAMRLNRAHVLFVEDLKPESRVVEAITNYKSQQSGGEK